MQPLSEKGHPPAYPQIGVASTCRSYREYMDMFGLNEVDTVDGPVLDVGGGASSFVAELAERGVEAVAADPLYRLPAEEALDVARKEIGTSSSKLAANEAAYDWSYYGTLERHRAMREASFKRFAADYTSAGVASRYVAASLPELPFRDGAFGLAVCSHFLFLYADAFGEAFHRAAVAELLRVVRPGGEARIYPLISLKWERPAYLDALLSSVADMAEASFVPTRLPFVPVASAALRLVRRGR